MLDDARPGGCLQIGYVDNQIEQFSGHAVAQFILLKLLRIKPEFIM